MNIFIYIFLAVFSCFTVVVIFIAGFVLGWIKCEHARDFIDGSVSEMNKD